MDQRTLVEQAGRGDHDAFATLVRERIARLDAAARLILRDAELARDAIQETLVRAWRDLPGLRDPDRFDAWLHRLMTRACIDAARTRRRRLLEISLTATTGRTSRTRQARWPTVTSSTVRSAGCSRMPGRSWCSFITWG